ncbi:pentatricopeptide repeat-containing protein At4g31070, mitochondrial [Malania oleifera]|uniref:pentatricopeptide repeat-containing protein At4g31070, mitochondrial n=1 Tax=Malania oleifera TaxID=397392 RepID=UPI0025ADEF40|nr:pentatricopeptide repeat-containing protein At4g31070, mitochondrial [Malania oleifera]
MLSKGLYDQCIEFYKEEVHPHDSGRSSLLLLPSVIKASACSQSYHFGLQLHCLVLKTGSHAHPVVSNSLISMYAKFSEAHTARQVFDAMPQQDVISWNSLINCYAQNGYCARALEMFEEARARGFVPKPELIASLLSVSSQYGDLRLGKAIHAVITIDERIEKESIFLSTALLDMYLRIHGDLEMASCVFDQMKEKNGVSWTVMVSGCTASQNYGMALDCFRTMQVEGFKPNRVSLIAVLPACAELGSVKHGKEIHGYSLRHGCDSEFRFSSALIHAYSHFPETLRHAKLIFERSTTKDVIMWSSLIRGYSQGGNGHEAMRLFHKMRMEGIEPNSITLLAIILACTDLSYLSYGRGVHGHGLKSGLYSDVFFGNSLIDMYAKCGFLMDSHQIFKEMHVKDATSWTALISGYGFHGCGDEALHFFHEMQGRGMEPDTITFLAILSACNHSGLVEEAQKLFYDAMRDGKIPLNTKHYACLIDLLGRSGKLEDACEILRTMPMEPSVRICSSLVSACKIHGRLELAEKLAHCLIKSEPENAANHTLLSMVYADSGNWLGVEEVRRLMKTRGLKKGYGFSRIELKDESLK